jgi:membrane fusion protein (multidrug efflux system)
MKQTFVKAALMAGCMAAAACGEAPTATAPGQYAVLTVATADRVIPANYPATIRGRQDIAIYPQVSGTISRLCITEGEHVTQGQPLFIIDQVPYKAALQTAEANVAAAKAGVATARLTFDAKKELFAKNIISQFELSTAENTLLTAEAQLAQAEAQRVNAANNLSYTVVKAPANGVAGTLPYRVGALVSPSIPQPLTTVSDNSTVYVYFSMSENQLLDLTRRYGNPRLDRRDARIDARRTAAAQRRLALRARRPHRIDQRRDRPLDGQRTAPRSLPQRRRTAPQRRCGQCRPATHV